MIISPGNNIYALIPYTVATHYGDNSEMKNTLFNAIDNHNWQPSYAIIQFIFNLMGLHTSIVNCPVFSTMYYILSFKCFLCIYIYMTPYHLLCMNVYLYNYL